LRMPGRFAIQLQQHCFRIFKIKIKIDSAEKPRF
jgi:hypothetical protein